MDDNFSLLMLLLEYTKSGQSWFPYTKVILENLTGLISDTYFHYNSAIVLLSELDKVL